MIGVFTDDVLRACAETAVHEYGLDVIQPRWLEDDFALDCLARDGDVLVAVHVISAGPGDSASDVADLSEDLIHRIRGAAQAWTSRHAFPCSEIRIDVLLFLPMLNDVLGVSYLEEVT